MLIHRTRTHRTRACDNSDAFQTELINYFIELCSGEIKSSIFLDKKQLRERAKLLKKLSVFTKELERAEEEMSHMRAERDRYNFSNSLRHFTRCRANTTHGTHGTHDTSCYTEHARDRWWMYRCPRSPC